MLEIENKKLERAILVAVRKQQDSKAEKQEHLTELEELAKTAGAETILKILQDRYKIDSAYYIGKGKVQEISALIELHNIDLIIFDDDLSPVQTRNLEKSLNRKIIDRSSLILDIFASHAKTKEAKTQIELAQLQYLLPRLTRAWTHLSKQYGGIGTKGPGETQIETDRRIIRNRIITLKEKLNKIEFQRKTQSRGRNNFIRLSLVGYTNAGKSTLFNLLTNAGVLSEDKLFATLDSTTRAFAVDKNNTVLISDTVGFIRKLPANLIASFKSTLKEVSDSDIILHVIDISHPYFEDHINTVQSTLKDLSCDRKLQFKIFNKIDLLKDKSLIEYISNKYSDSVIISAERSINVNNLKKKISDYIEKSFVEEKIFLPIQNSRLAAFIHSTTEVISTKYDDNSVEIIYRTNKENSNKIKKMVHG